MKPCISYFIPFTDMGGTSVGFPRPFPSDVDGGKRSGFPEPFSSVGPFLSSAGRNNGAVASSLGCNEALGTVQTECPHPKYLPMVVSSSILMTDLIAFQPAFRFSLQPANLKSST